MITKTEKNQYFFEAQITWEGGRKGTLSADDIPLRLPVATPPEFAGGVAGTWSPEALFLGSLNSCLMATYLAFAEKKQLTIKNFDCNAIGQVELVQGHLEFTIINLFPKITVAREEETALANEVLMKTYRHCIIANSIKSHLVHHGEVVVGN